MKLEVSAKEGNVLVFCLLCSVCVYKIFIYLFNYFIYGSKALDVMVNDQSDNER